MRGLMALPLLMLALSGCLSNESSPDGGLSTDGGLGAVEPEAPFHLDETFDLLQPMDQTWTWSMSPGMTGDVTIELEGNPAWLEGPDNVCFELSWPEGSHYQRSCDAANGNVVVSVAVSTLLDTATIYDVYLIPNDFTLRVWTGTPDTASLRVYAETFAAPNSA